MKHKDVEHYFVLKIKGKDEWLCPGHMFKYSTTTNLCEASLFDIDCNDSKYAIADAKEDYDYDGIEIELQKVMVTTIVDTE